METNEQAQDGVVILPEDPGLPDISELLAVHLKAMRAQSPACSVHALDLGALRTRNITFWSMRNARKILIGFGALKTLTPKHGEIKSMHIAKAHRGSGAARRLLMHILAEAKRRDYDRVSLETGSQAEFEPARNLYKTAGFEETTPFDTYKEDPNSVFMTLCLRHTQ